MSYARHLVFEYGTTVTNARVQIRDADGTANGALQTPITLGTGSYGLVASIPDDHRGWASLVALAASTTYLLTMPVNPESSERENTLWRRFFKKVTLNRSTGALITYADDGTTPVTSQTASDDGTTQTQGAS
jgi:hypothetical protein